jgi:membrane protease YdiL (CAAX protease family)
LIPLNEEVIYRMIIPRIFGRNMILSTLASTGLFCYAHRQSFPLLSMDMLVCALGGAALGTRTWKRNKGSIIESFFIHSLHNLHVVLEPPDRADRPIPWSISPVSFYTALLVLDGVRTVLRRKKLFPLAKYFDYVL